MADRRAWAAALHSKVRLRDDGAPGLAIISPPLDRLPDALTETIQELAHVQQVSHELALACVLGALSIAASPFRTVMLPYGREVPTALYLVATAETSARKSTTVDLVLKGIKRFQREEDARHAKRVDRFRIQKVAHEKLVMRATRDGQISEKEVEELAEAKPKKPEPWIAMTNSSSPAGLAKNLADGPGTTALFAAEVDPILNEDLLDHLGDFNGYYSGEAKRRELGGQHGSIEMESASLTLFVLGQPVALDEFERPSQDRLRRTGFTARVLYLHCPPFQGVRPLSIRIASAAKAIEMFNEKTYELLTGNAEAHNRVAVTFDADAATLYEEYAHKLEIARQPQSITADIADLFGKGAENAARIAALIAASDGNRAEITAKDFAAATDLMNCFFGWSRFRYGENAVWSDDEENIRRGYRHLWQWCIENPNNNRYPYARWRRFAPLRVRSSEARDRVLQLLQERGAIAVDFTTKPWAIVLLPTAFPVRPNVPAGLATMVSLPPHSRGW